MRRAFTLLEVVVAVGLLALMLLFSSAIFRVSIDSHRQAMANAEIMRNFRALTDQLNADFKGARTYLNGQVGYGFDDSDINGDGKIDTSEVKNVRSDVIAFFSVGDFQSTGQYGSSGSEKTIAGNAASIYYGLAKNSGIDPKKKILVRRQTIVTVDSGGALADASNDPLEEYYKTSVSQWRADPPCTSCEWITLQDMDLNKKEDLATYMIKGIDDFKIQFLAEWHYASGNFVWRPVEEAEFEDYERISTRAIKFTFKLYDSKGIIENGRTFTHIVYLVD